MSPDCCPHCGAPIEESRACPSCGPPLSSLAPGPGSGVEQSHDNPPRQQSARTARKAGWLVVGVMIAAHFGGLFGIQVGGIFGLLSGEVPVAKAYVGIGFL